MARARELFARLRVQGTPAIDELIAGYQSENLWLDFKRSSDNGTGTYLSHSDRENLAKAISGFANSDGGVVLWGVDCRRDATTGADLPRDKHRIVAPSSFVSWLENAVSGCVTPPAPGVEHVAITESDGTGFVATLIPPSDLAPHQCIQPPSRPQYFMRVGSSFALVPHAVLAGMFGRRPQPKLSTFYDGQTAFSPVPEILQLDLGVRLLNEGPAVAANPYLSFRIVMPGPLCKIEFKPSTSGEWTNHQAFAAYFNVTAQPTFRLAPQSPVRPVRFVLRFQPPFNNDYAYEMHFGADGASPGHVIVELEADELSTVYSEAVTAVKAGGSNTLQRIFPEFFGQREGVA